MDPLIIASLRLTISANTIPSLLTILSFYEKGITILLFRPIVIIDHVDHKKEKI